MSIYRKSFVAGLLMAMESRYPLTTREKQNRLIKGENTASLKKGPMLCRTITFPKSGGNTWIKKDMHIPANFWNGYIWSDGSDIYYSNGTDHYVIRDGRWEGKTWNGHNDFSGNNIWTDGSNVYYSCDGTHYVLNGDTWEVKSWSGYAEWIDGCEIWSDGSHIYHSNNGAHYVLNGDTWDKTVWYGLTNFIASYIWSDGEIIYYSDSATAEQYWLDGDRWRVMSWSGHNPARNSIWTDGENIYCSEGASGHYILNGNTWEPKTWSGYTDFSGNCVWTDGRRIYACGKSASLFFCDEVYALAHVSIQHPVNYSSLMLGWLMGKKILGRTNNT